MRIRGATVAFVGALVVLVATSVHFAASREPADAGSLESLRTKPVQTRVVAPVVVEASAAVAAFPVDAPVPPPEPRRIMIPALGVDAPIVAVGVTEDLVLEVPESPRDVGWYRHGPAPGAVSGSAVLASHVDTAEEGAGVFFGLAGLDPGAVVEVEHADGSVTRYEVIARRQFPKAELPEHDVFATDGAPRLSLVTCGGEFDAERRSYADNIVVTAVPVT